jgi:Flp pilus assembly protein TadG
MRSPPRRTAIELRKWRDATCDLSRDRRAISAVEFALLAPVFALLLVGEFALGEAIAISRKVAVTGHTVVDLVTRSSAMNDAQITAILNASAQIAAPFSTSDMVIVVAHLKTDASNNTTVDWSRSLHGDQLVDGARFAPPAGVVQASTSMIYGAVRYDYRPPVGAGLIGSIPISYSLFMNPRISASIPMN